MDNFTKQELFLIQLGILKVISDTKEVIERIDPINNPGGLQGWQERLTIAESAKNKINHLLNH